MMRIVRISLPAKRANQRLLLPSIQSLYQKSGVNGWPFITENGIGKNTESRGECGHKKTSLGIERATGKEWTIARDSSYNTQVLGAQRVILRQKNNAIEALQTAIQCIGSGSCRTIGGYRRGQINPVRVGIVRLAFHHVGAAGGGTPSDN